MVPRGNQPFISHPVTLPSIANKQMERVTLLSGDLEKSDTSYSYSSVSHITEDYIQQMLFIIRTRLLLSKSV